MVHFKAVHTIEQ